MSSIPSCGGRLPFKRQGGESLPDRTNAPYVQIEPWAEGDFDPLRRINAPEMMSHLGGPKTEKQILARHQRYVGITGSGTGRMFRIVLLPECEAVGGVGYWESVWKDEPIYETGWGVLPPFQG